MSIQNIGWSIPLKIDWSVLSFDYFDIVSHLPPLDREADKFFKRGAVLGEVWSFSSLSGGGGGLAKKG